MWLHSEGTGGLGEKEEKAISFRPPEESEMTDSETLCLNPVFPVALCMLSHFPKGCFCAFPPVSRTILRRELSARTHSVWANPQIGGWLFFSLYFRHTALFHACLGLEE